MRDGNEYCHICEINRELLEAAELAFKELLFQFNRAKQEAFIKGQIAFPNDALQKLDTAIKNSKAQAQL